MITTQLKNDIKIVSDKIDNLDTVSLGIFIGTGSKNENAQEQGITHFIEHMLFKSNSFYKNNDATEEIAKKGGIVNGFTTKEYMCIYTKSLKEEISSILNVLFKMISTPSFYKNEIEIEKKVIFNEIERNRDNKYNLVHENLLRNFYKDHSLARGILGTWDSIKEFNRETLLSYYSKIISNSQIVVSVSGNFEENLLEQITSLFESLSSRRQSLNRLNETEHIKPNVGLDTSITFKDINQHHLCLGYPTLTYNSPELSSLMVYNQLLGVGNTSFLAKNIRDLRGVAYSIGSIPFLYQESGLLTINVASHIKNDIHWLKDMLLKLLKNDFKNQMNLEQISVAKTKFKSNILFSLENSISRMLEFGKKSILNIHINSNEGSLSSGADQVIENIESVTVEKVLNIHDRLLSAPPTFSVITNK